LRGLVLESDECANFVCVHSMVVWYGWQYRFKARAEEENPNPLHGYFIEEGRVLNSYWYR